MVWNRNFLLTLFLDLVFYSGSSSLIHMDTISVILDQPFKNLANSLIVTDIADKKLHLKLAKMMFRNSDHIKLVPLASWTRLTTEPEVRSNGIVCMIQQRQSIGKVNHLINVEDWGTKQPILLLVQNSSMVNLIQSPRINQGVYIVDMQSWKMTSVYQINNHLERAIVGEYRIFRDFRPQDLKFNFNANWKRFLPENRDNFHGIYLKAMMDEDSPFTTFDPDFRSRAKFHPGNQTYDITELSSGVYIDIGHSLAKDFNFSLSIYKRKDGVWGHVIGNNTVTGILSNLQDGSADLVLAGYGMLLFRLPFVNYLPVITTNMPDLFIRNDPVEAMNWSLIFKPFGIDVWTMLVLSAFVYAVIFYWINSSKSLVPEKKILEFLGYFSLAFLANFGRKPQNPMSNKTIAAVNSVLIFVCLLMGNLTWIAYRASITSELSNMKVTHPFTSLETMLSTNYILGTAPQGTAEADSLFNPVPGSIYEQVAQGHMADPGLSFVPVKQGLELLTSRKDYAYFNNRQLVLSDTRFQCQIVSVWHAKHVFNSYSIGFGKRSPYARSLSMSILRRIERGILHFEIRKHLKQLPNCTPLLVEANPLGLKKLLTVFNLLILAFIMTLGVLVCENIKAHKRSNKVDYNVKEEDQTSLTMMRLAVKHLQKAYKSNPNLVMTALGNLTLYDTIELFLADDDKQVKQVAE